MADPNNMLLHEHRLCLMLICKAGNTSIKWAIAGAMGLEETHRTDLYFPTPNKADAQRYRDEDYLVLSVIRHPLARIASCWLDKVSSEARFHQPFRRKYGGKIRPGMSFPEWVRLVGEIPDGIADQHFRSMTWDLVTDEVVPETIKIERDDWWSVLRTRISNHCGMDIGRERWENRTKTDWRSMYDEETKALAVNRYKRDLEIFGYDA